MQSIVEPENEDEFAEEPLSQNGENLLTRRNRRTFFATSLLNFVFLYQQAEQLFILPEELVFL